MSEIEIGGATIRGGKLLLLIPLLGNAWWWSVGWV
jgi:hypothetical protein